jgi:hypothetical protein
MYVRLLYVFVIAAAVVMGTAGQQLLALAVAGVLVTRRAVIVHYSHEHQAHPARSARFAHRAAHAHREPVLR